MEKDKQFDDKLREIGDMVKHKYFSIKDDAKREVIFEKHFSEKTYPAVPKFGK